MLSELMEQMRWRFEKSEGTSKGASVLTECSLRLRLISARWTKPSHQQISWLTNTKEATEARAFS